jgi:hypothetical protein
MPIEHYSDEQIDRLLTGDRVTAVDRAAMRRRWGAKARQRRRRA